MKLLVTGASRGIGRAIALECAKRHAGATIGIGFHASRHAAEETAHLVAEAGGKPVLCGADMADGEAVEQAFASFAREAHGLDAVVVNAATHSAGLLATADLSALERLVRVNTFGPLVCARAALGPMLAQKRGLLLFLGTIASSRPARGQAAYAATKASVEALTRAIAVEYGRKGIRAICLRPGAVMTDMLEATMSMAEGEIVSRIPVRRVADPAEIARFALLLLGDDAAYASGAIIDFDGGYGAS
jgi:3-oxoacyl-[acyl-carrier protein] reductase